MRAECFPLIDIYLQKGMIASSQPILASIEIHSLLAYKHTPGNIPVEAETRCLLVYKDTPESIPVEAETRCLLVYKDIRESVHMDVRRGKGR